MSMQIELEHFAFCVCLVSSLQFLRLSFGFNLGKFTFESSISSNNFVSIDRRNIRTWMMLGHWNLAAMTTMWPASRNGFQWRTYVQSAKLQLWLIVRRNKYILSVVYNLWFLYICIMIFWYSLKRRKNKLFKKICQREC